jgi:hypothetical protein
VFLNDRYLRQQFNEAKATQTEEQLTEAKKDGQNCLVRFFSFPYDK